VNSTDPLVDEIITLTRNGLSARTIANRLGVTPRTVVRWRSKRGASKGPGYPPVTKERLAQAKALLEDGASRSEVQRTLHISEYTLKRNFPGCGWSSEESIRFAVAMRQANRRMRALP
jgi:DNA invertase Pin-like site-specific DNA recombinase